MVIALYVLSFIFWVAFVGTTHYTSTLSGWQYAYLLIPFLIGETIIPLAGGIIGLHNATKWGKKTVMGRSSLALGLGMLAWSGGMIIWNYYLFLTTVSVPYPSLADAIFILSWPLWTYGIIQLSKAFGIKFAFRKTGKAFLLIPIILAVFSVYLIGNVARGGITYSNPVKLFFDLFYPLGDIVILSVTASVYLLLRKYMGGVYKAPALILFFGFLLNYIGDFWFSYTTTQGTYFNGAFPDLLYTTTMFVLSVGLSLLTPAILDIAKRQA